MATKTHTYSDGSKIELGTEPGKRRHQVEATRPATGRAALRLPPEQTTRPDRDF